MALAKSLLAIIMVSDSMGALSDMLNRHQNTRVTSLEIVFFCVLAVLLSLTLYSSPIAKLLPTHDQSMFVYFGNAIDAGKIPYVDMFDHKGPILWLINALGWLQIGPIRVLWLIEIAVITISCIYMFKLSLYFANRATSLVATLVGLLMLMRFSIGGNIFEEYALPCIAMTLYLMLSYLTGGRSASMAFCDFWPDGYRGVFHSAQYGGAVGRECHYGNCGRGWQAPMVTTLASCNGHTNRCFDYYCATLTLRSAHALAR